MHNGQPINIPLTVNLHIEKFAGGAITRIESGATNMVYAQYADGRWYATQRPGVRQFEDASETVSDNRGRGAYYWDAVGAKYIVNNDTVYKTSYSGSTMTISAGTERVFMGEVGDYLVIIDAENNEGWYIASGTSTTIHAIADTDFPPEQTPALSLAKGGAILNGKLYVMTTDGDIYECDVEDPTSWGGLNFTNAEVSPDDGIMIGKHFDSVVAFGSRTIEFFQDTANPTGSTLTARGDIQFDVGVVDTDSLFQVGERLYFVGQDSTGGIGAYVIDDFQLRKISTNDMDTYLTTAITQDSVDVLGCGFISGGREFYVMTIYNVMDDIVPKVSLVFSSTKSWWGFWDLQLPDIDYFPLMAWIPNPSTQRAGEGILANGDLITMLDDFNPIDGVGSSAVYEAGVFEDDVYTATGGYGTSIPFTIITGVIENGTSQRKKMGDLWVMHTPIDADEDFTISLADEQNATYSLSYDVSANDYSARINRLGSYRRRNIKLTGTLSEQARLESLQATVRAG